jgi:hypothetical protein
MKRAIAASLTILAGAAGLFVAASALQAPAARAQPAPPSPPRVAQACFYSSDIAGFSAPDDHTLFIRTGVHNIWRIDLASDCQDLSFREHIRISAAAGMGSICTPLDLDISTHANGMRMRCIVRSLTKLTPDQVAALPKRYLP